MLDVLSRDRSNPVRYPLLSSLGCLQRLLLAKEVLSCWLPYSRQPCLRRSYRTVCLPWSSKLRKPPRRGVQSVDSDPQQLVSIDRSITATIIIIINTKIVYTRSTPKQEMLTRKQKYNTVKYMANVSK